MVRGPSSEGVPSNAIVPPSQLHIVGPEADRRVAHEPGVKNTDEINTDEILSKDSHFA